MTEAEWLTSVDPEPMLKFLHGKASERKCRFFGSACSRRVLHLMTDERCRRAVEVADRIADGELLGEEWAAVFKAADDAVEDAVLAADSAVEPKSFAATMMTEFLCNVSAIVSQTGVGPYGSIVLPGSPGLISGVVAKVIQFRKGLELGLVIHRWDEVDTGPTLAARNSELAQHVPLLHDIFGNPFRPARVDPAWLAWNHGTVRLLAEAIYAERAFERMPILADALEEAGCGDADLLRHCRQSDAVHVRGCWVVDLLTGRA